MTSAPRVRACAPPPESRINAFVEPGDFLDCFAVAADRPVREAAEVIVDYPGWVNALMALRRLVTMPFGLINEFSGTSDRIGLFPIQSEDETEIVAGFDDKHLNFRISIAAHDAQIFFATWVKPHNVGGRLYLASVMPFHKLIIRNALTRLATSGR